MNRIRTAIAKAFLWSVIFPWLLIGQLRKHISWAFANAKAAMSRAVKAAQAGDMKTAADYAQRSLALQPAWEVA